MEDKEQRRAAHLENMRVHFADFYNYISGIQSDNPEVISKKGLLMSKLEVLLAELREVRDPASRRSFLPEMTEINDLTADLKMLADE